MNLAGSADNIDAQFTRHGNNQLEIRWTSAIGRDLALRLLSAPVASIVDSKLAEQHAVNHDFGNGWLKTHSAGSAAYAIKTYVPQQALVLEQNPNAQPQPKLKRVILKGVSDPGSRRLLLEQGDADVAYELGADQFDALKKVSSVRVASFPSSLIYYLGFNTQDKAQPALGNPALWQAARWLVDYQSISHELLKDQYQVHQAFLPQGFDGALENQPFKYDLAKAKEILKQRRHQAGTQFSLTIVNQPPYTDVGAGFNRPASPRPIFRSPSSRLPRRSCGPRCAAETSSRSLFTGALITSIPTLMPAPLPITCQTGRKHLAWRVGWSIPKLSAETKAAAAESNVKTRNALYQQLQTEVQQNSPYVVTLQDKNWWDYAVI